MQVVRLYRYEREPGCYTISPTMPNCEHTILHRIIADDGMILVNKDIKTCVADVETIDGWTESPYDNLYE